MDRVNAGVDHERLILRDEVHERLGGLHDGVLGEDGRAVDHPRDGRADVEPVEAAEERGPLFTKLEFAELDVAELADRGFAARVAEADRLDLETGDLAPEPGDIRGQPTDFAAELRRLAPERRDPARLRQPARERVFLDGELVAGERLLRGQRGQLRLGAFDLVPGLSAALFDLAQFLLEGLATRLEQYLLPLDLRDGGLAFAGEQVGGKGDGVGLVPLGL